MDAIEKINAVIRGSGKTLVFTSETAARNAMLSYIKENPGKAVFSDRFQSWDKFSLALSDTEGKRAVTETERRIFTRSFLKNGGMDRLRHFSSPIYSESLPSFVRYIARLLPFFPKEGDEKRASISPDILFDIDLIRPRYVQYLEENGLYEENYLDKDLDRIKEGTTVLVFPEAFTSTFADTVVKSGKVEVIPVPRDFSPSTLHAYPNSISEIRSVMRKIEKDLETFPPDEIAITSSSLETYRPYLEEEAKKRDIPLAFTSRSSLSSYPEGRIMKTMYSLVLQRWTLQSVKALFMDPSFPFKDRDLLLSIVRIGIDQKCADGGYERWMRAFDRAKNDDCTNKEEAKELFSSIYRDTELIVKAKNPQDTSLRFRAFRDKYFEENEWNENEDKILGSMLEVLSLMGNGEDTDTFRIFLSILDDTSYVERTETEGKVKVYSYPASAGLQIRRHYIMGLDDKSTSLSIDDFPYSRDDDKPEPKDLTESLLSLYANPEFAPFLYISGTEENYSGSVLLPTFFLDNSIEEKEKEEDSYSDEMKKDKTRQCTRSQASSYRRAEATVLRKRDDQVVVPSISSTHLTTSVSGVKNWDDCPYKGYASTILSLSKKEYEAQMEDVLEKGNILHRTLESSLTKVETLGDITPEILLENLKREMDESVRKGRIPDEASRLHMEKSLWSHLSSFPESSGIDHFSSASLFGNEIALGDLNLGENFSLKGRLDTLLKDEGGKWYILDYKISGDSDWDKDSIDDTSLQIILYYRLLTYPGTTWDREEEKPSHFSVECGGFYSMGKGQFRLVWPRVIGDEIYSLEEIEENAEKRINEILHSFKSGNVTPTPGEDNCVNCDYKRLCRGRFIAK
ncbi:MAG: PD-(D/E)XK nuclease family protein [Candidatus Ornithospirochaeta sp.]